MRWVGTLERGGNSPKGAPRPRARREFARGGATPSSEVGTHPRGRHTLERGGGFTVRCLPLERDRGLPEGCRDWQFDGPLRFFGP
jgi:hypothetical protein